VDKVTVARKLSFSATRVVDSVRAINCDPVLTKDSKAARAKDRTALQLRGSTELYRTGNGATFY
jgi:hypothetical protein